MTNSPTNPETPRCPKCGSAMRGLEFDPRDRGYWVGWKCPLDPKDCRIAELEAQLAAREAALAEADRALIEMAMYEDPSEEAGKTYHKAIAREANRRVGEKEEL